MIKSLEPGDCIEILSNDVKGYYHEGVVQSEHIPEGEICLVISARSVDGIYDEVNSFFYIKCLYKMKEMNLALGFDEFRYVGEDQ